MKTFNIDLTRIRNFSFKSFSLPFNLSRRDRVALAAAGMALGVFIVLQLTIFPILDRRVRLRNDIKSHKSDLAEMQTIQKEHAKLSRNTGDLDRQLKSRPRNFTLFSFIDQLAGKHGIKKNITSMKPSTTNLRNSPYGLSSVEMKISALTMEQLVPFLHGVENSRQMVWIKRISIAKGAKKASLLDVVLQVVTLKR